VLPRPLRRDRVGSCRFGSVSSWSFWPSGSKSATACLRYFVAVAEEGSLAVAAERRLHTAQPSLSRQIRDLEYEAGAQLVTRSARGIELTAAGRAFLDHA